MMDADEDDYYTMMAMTMKWLTLLSNLPKSDDDDDDDDKGIKACLLLFLVSSSHRESSFFRASFQTSHSWGWAQGKERERKQEKKISETTTGASSLGMTWRRKRKEGDMTDQELKWGLKWGLKMEEGKESGK